MTLESGYTFNRVAEDLDYDFASDGALAGGVSEAEAGGSFPDLLTTDHLLQTSLRFEIREGIALRFFHRYQRSEIDVFRQTGLTPLGVDGALFLGHVDRDYDAHVFGFTLQLRFRDSP